MNEVTRITSRRGRRGWLTVLIDGVRSFDAPDEVAATLHVGLRLSDAELDALLHEAAYRDALHRGMRLLTYRPRSRVEIVRKLAATGLDPAAVEAAVARLNELGLLDDRAFAQWWVENRCEHRPRAAWALRHELRQLGVDRGAIDAAVRAVDDSELAAAAARKRAGRLAGLDRDEFDRRLGAHLTRRGFSGEDVRRALDVAWSGLRSQHD